MGRKKEIAEAQLPSEWKLRLWLWLSYVSQIKDKNRMYYSGLVILGLTLLEIISKSLHRFDRTSIAVFLAKGQDNYYRVGFQDELGRSALISQDASISNYPILSPDGKTLAYSEGIRQNATFEINLVVEPFPNGGGRKIVLRNLGTFSHPQWFPTGKKIAFLSNFSGDQKWETVYAVDVETQEIILLTPGSNVNIFNISPSGKRIAYYSEDSLYYKDLETQKTTRIPLEQVSNPTTDPYWLGWTADSQKITFVYDQQLYVHDTPTGLPRSITPPGKLIANSFPSPIGDRIAYIELDDQTQKVVVVRSDGSDPIIAFESPDGYPLPIGWTNDGGQLIYSIYSLNVTGTRKHNQIVVAPADGTGQPRTVISLENALGVLLLFTGELENQSSVLTRLYGSSQTGGS